MTPSLIRSPSELPGWLEAVEAERTARELPLVAPYDTVDGHRIVHLTLRKYVTLRFLESPYIPPYRTPTPIDTLRFVWVMSPEFSIDDQAGRRRILRSLREIVPPVPLFLFRRRYERKLARSLMAHARLIKKLRDFVDASLMDRPAASREGVSSPGGVVDVCGLATSAWKIGLTPEQYLDMPISLLFQYLIVASGRSIQTNPLSDKIVNDYQNQFLV